MVQQAPQKLPKEIEDGLRKSDVIWVGVEADGRRRLAPRGSPTRTGGSSPVPARTRARGADGPRGRSAPELSVVTRRKLRDTALDEFPASKRLSRDPEWEEAAKVLADRRRSRVGSPAESLARWRTTCDIVELTPVLPA